MTKKAKILDLLHVEPKLTRAEIARQAGCSTAYVTQALGAVRKYEKKTKPETKEPAVAD